MKLIPKYQSPSGPFKVIEKSDNTKVQKPTTYESVKRVAHPGHRLVTIRGKVYEIPDKNEQVSSQTTPKVIQEEANRAGKAKEWKRKDTEDRRLTEKVVGAGLGLGAFAAAQGTPAAPIIDTILAGEGANGLLEQSKEKTIGLNGQTAWNVASMFPLGLRVLPKVIKYSDLAAITNNAYNLSKQGINWVGNNVAKATNGRLYDPYTTIGGRFGYYGSWPKRIYNTVTRNVGLKGTNSMPELLRLEKGIDLTNPEAYAAITRESIGGRFPWINSTTSRFVVDHSSGKWKGNSGIIYDPQMFSAKNYLSVQPSDTFIQGTKNVTSPKQFTLVSGNVEELKAAQAAGLETLSTPKMREAYEAFKTTQAEAEANGVGEIKIGRLNIGKGALHDDEATKAAANYYTQTMNEAVSRRGTPTYQDYQYQAEQAGLPIEVTEGVPVYDRAIGFGIDADGKSIHLTKPYYNNVVYHNASPIESKVKTAIHVDRNPTQAQVEYWKAHPEELKALARNTATFNKEVTVNGQTFKVRQNPDGVIDMTRGLDSNGNIVNLELEENIMSTARTAQGKPTNVPQDYLQRELQFKFGGRLKLIPRRNN